MRAVAIGGGHGLARTLRALRTVAHDTTAVVTVADDGGSSGRLRRDLGVLPPGDLRMALTALAPPGSLRDLVGHRFTHGELAGHSLGNLLLVGLIEQHGGHMVAALDAMAQLLDSRGRVLPCTAESVTLHAQAGDDIVHGQQAVAGTENVSKVWLEPADPAPTPAVIDAIAAADMVVVGPGSLFTSVLPNLLVAGMADAIRASHAQTVFIGNLREQPGETSGLTLVDHLDVLERHVGSLAIDLLVAHDSDDEAALPVDVAALDSRVGEVVCAPLAAAGDLDAGHDPRALAAILERAMQGTSGAA